MPYDIEQQRKETKEMLGIIYRDYLCDDEERINLLQEEKRELTKLEDEKREIYNLDNIFKKNNLKENNEENSIKNEVSIVEYKESIIKRIITKIKNLFHIH